MQRILFQILILTVIAGHSDLLAQTFAERVEKALPYPKNFDAAKYLGKWYEIARLPSPAQPSETLATAEYSAAEDEGEIVVKNTAYSTTGKLIREITGKAQIQEGDPPRLKVSFGPAFPSKPNYFVMHVSKKYDLALVGNPDRKALWILSRKSDLPEKRLARMIAKAKKSGFKTDDLIISDWSKTGVNAAESDRVTKKRLLGTWHYLRGDKNGEALDENRFKGQRVEITEKDMTLRSEGMVFVMAYELVKETHPQAVNLTITESPFGAGQKSQGIIALEGGTLKLCYPPMGGDRPMKFDGSAGSNQHYFELKRAPLSAEQILGTWKFESGRVEGRESDVNRLAGSKVIITKDKLTLNSGDASFVMEYTLNTSKQPAKIDLKITEGPFGEGARAPGIVKLQDGKLFICYNPRGGEAPVKFEAGNEHSLFVLSLE